MSRYLGNLNVSLAMSVTFQKLSCLRAMQATISPFQVAHDPKVIKVQCATACLAMFLIAKTYPGILNNYISKHLYSPSIN